MVQTDVSPIVRTGDPSVREKYRKKTVTPYILGGLAIVLVIAVGAVAFGVADTEGALDDVVNEIPVVGGDDDDGWDEFSEPRGVWTAELPDEPTEQELVVLSDQGETTTYVVTIEGLMDIAIANTTGAGFATDGPVGLRLASIVDRWVAHTGGNLTDEAVETTFAGYPALAFTIEEYSREGDPAHLYGLAIQVGGDVIVVTVDSFEENPDQYQRVLDGLVIGAGTETTQTTSG
jgi:hypothetical protein